MLASHFSLFSQCTQYLCGDYSRRFLFLPLFSGFTDMLWLLCTCVYWPQVQITVPDIFASLSTIRPEHCLGTAWVIIWISFRHIRAHQANRQTVSAQRDTEGKRYIQPERHAKSHEGKEIKMGGRYSIAGRGTLRRRHTLQTIFNLCFPKKI